MKSKSQKRDQNDPELLIIQTKKNWKLVLDNNGVRIYRGKYKTLDRAIEEADRWDRELWQMGMEPEGWKIVRERV